ncbi:bifunctional polymyxin resistance protein ArnA [Sideroxyarcus emersonii]|uniref:Bifunctional polymyxin resistance protein ArnA n=1 Tax=Sideroxyarcus emersonii TaxID=2764705 RepID=A0AAN2BYQ0_9PROT|nr:formyltransferase [Sideroxyarcus emersonii]BCK87384.1 bifunctional polymyxin resistance protein ArnA [Sideroxyarcus emersonii]
MSRAVVLAYHNVGVRCLNVLLAHGVDVALVVTHRDNPKETIWFESVQKLAELHGIPTITPDNPNVPEVEERIRALQPDFYFSFYYREMLKAPLLAIPRRGALNMHGSLLPKYRGRVPVNWAIIRGETETGATLHYMTEKPDNGDIVAQQAVPILPNDTAFEVFQKVTVAAEMALNGVLPSLLAGKAQAVKQDLSKGAYFGGRKAEDGIIDWTQSASQIHNLVRAVAPPYPGATTQVMGKSMRILQTLVGERAASGKERPAFYVKEGRAYATCGSGLLRVVRFELDGVEMSAAEFAAKYGAEKFEFNR